jgi:hypothetical protein
LDDVPRLVGSIQYQSEKGGLYPAFFFVFSLGSSSLGSFSFEIDYRVARLSATALSVGQPFTFSGVASSHQMGV